MNINAYSKKIHASTSHVGWWDDPNPCIFQALQLISTEIAEATEGERKNLMDDHLPKRHMGEVELADALIRTLDLAGFLDWRYICLEQGHHWAHELNSIGKQHFACNIMIVRLGELMAHGQTNTQTIWLAYSGLVNTILKVAEISHYDIEMAMIEKIEYNKTRADHQRENRELEHGKKW